MKLERLKLLANARPCVVAISLLLTAAALSAASSETYYFFAFNNPVAGQEDEFNRWYNEQHLADIVATPGFVTAQRFVLNDEQPHRASAQMPKYLAIYKIVSDDVKAVLAEMSRRGRNGEVPKSPSFDEQTNLSYVYRTFRPEIKGVGGEPAGARPGSKQTYLQIVFTAPVDGKEDEFNTWYDKTGAADFADSPGFVSTQRMILERPPSNGTPATKYLTLLKIETSDIAIVLKTLAAQPSHPNPALDGNSMRGYTYRAIGPVIEGDKVRAARAGK